MPASRHPWVEVASVFGGAVTIHALPYILLQGLLAGSTLVVSRFGVAQFHPVAYNWPLCHSPPSLLGSTCGV
jgi:hypothetical protein